MSNKNKQNETVPQNAEQEPTLDAESAIFGDAAETGEKKQAKKKYPVEVYTVHYQDFLRLTGSKSRSGKATKEGQILATFAAVAYAELGAAKLAELIQKHRETVEQVLACFSAEKEAEKEAEQEAK